MISTDVSGARGDHAALARSIDAKLRRLQLSVRDPTWVQVIAERRATYTCVAGLPRPAAGLIAPRIALAGDFTDVRFSGNAGGGDEAAITAARALLDSDARAPD